MGHSARHKKEIRALRVGDIRIDHSYQRPLNEAHAQRISHELDPLKFGYPVVSERADGSLWAVDGQQRLGALRLLGWENQRIDCEVYRGLTVAEEADIFYDINVGRIPVKTFFKFRSALFAGHAIEVAIEHIARQAGFGLGPTAQPGVISAVMACKDVYLGRRSRLRRGPQPQALRSTLETIREAWGTNEDGTRGELIKGIGQIFIRDAAAIDRGNLANKLKSYPGGPGSLVASARGLHAMRKGNLVDAVSEAIVDVYNRGRRVNKLEPWR